MLTPFRFVRALLVALIGVVILSGTVSAVAQAVCSLVRDDLYAEVGSYGSYGSYGRVMCSTAANGLSNGMVSLFYARQAAGTPPCAFSALQGDINDLLHNLAIGVVYDALGGYGNGDALCRTYVDFGLFVHKLDGLVYP